MCIKLKIYIYKIIFVFLGQDNVRKLTVVTVAGGCGTEPDLSLQRRYEPMSPSSGKMA